MKPLQIVGMIDDKAFLQFSTELRELERKKIKTVHVELSSGGGSAYDALALYSRIRQSPCDVIITTYGLVASAAVLVLAAGDKRIMTKESWVMVHEESVQELSCDVSHLEKCAKQGRREENQWCYLLEKATGTSASLWADLHKKESYLNSRDCLTLGLATEII